MHTSMRHHHHHHPSQQQTTSSTMTLLSVVATTTASLIMAVAAILAAGGGGGLTAVEGRPEVALRITSDGITCPPRNDDERSPTIEEIFYYSDVVVVGKVTRQFPQPGGVYTAQMDVYCVYKGDNVPKTINITDAGVVPGRCFSTEFNESVSYATYLKQHRDGRLTPTYKQHPENYKDELAIMCGVTVSTPAGAVLPSGMACEGEAYEYDEEEDYDKCFNFDPNSRKDPTYEHVKEDEKAIEQEQAKEEEQANEDEMAKEDETPEEDGGVRKGQVVKPDDNDDDDDDDDGSSSGPHLRSSFLLPALLLGAILVFS